MTDVIDPAVLAEQFHEAYERLAPSFGYTTRQDSAVPWADVPETNKALMIAVIEEIGPLFRSVVHACCVEVRTLDEELARVTAERDEARAEIKAVKLSALQMRNAFRLPAFFTWEESTSLYSSRFGEHPWPWATNRKAQS